MREMTPLWTGIGSGVPVSSSCPLTPVPPPGLARHTWGAGKEVGPHLQGSIPGSEGGHWSQLQTEKPGNTYTPPALPGSELPRGLHTGSANPLLSGLWRTGSGWCRVTSAGFRTKALLCGNPGHGHGEGEGSQPRAGTWPRDVLPRCGLQGRAAPGVTGRIHSLGWGH